MPVLSSLPFTPFLLNNNPAITAASQPQTLWSPHCPDCTDLGGPAGEAGLHAGCSLLRTAERASGGAAQAQAG